MITTGKYILFISIHGLIRSKDLELGRDSDTGGQTKYVVEVTEALSKSAEVEKVDLMTKLIIDERVSTDYSQPIDTLNPKANIVRISCGNDEYIHKEELWDYLDNFADNALNYLKSQDRLPDVIHTHYADAGYVGIRLSNRLEIPLIHTGHSLGRSKRKRLLASGINRQKIEDRYNITRRINAEEDTLASAVRIITSTNQEINEQYAQYDYYTPQQMRVVPPGTDLQRFHAPVGDEWKSSVYKRIAAFLRDSKKPMILALSRLDQRKNIQVLIEAFGESPELQEKANLVIFTGSRDDLRDLESDAQSILLDLLVTIDQYDLYGKVAYPKILRAEDVSEVYRLAALSKGVFVNPALTEPFGLTLIEAAGSGLPIVATQDGGPVDIIKNCQNGYLMDPLDTKDIADKILKTIDDPSQWEIFSKNGQVNVQKNYSWDSHIKTYLDVIRPIIDKTEFLERDALKRRPMMYHNGALVTTLDQNLLGDDVSLQELIEVLEKNRKTVCFCIATGRRLKTALRVIRNHNIPQPDVLITSSGTEIYYDKSLTKDNAWTTHIDYQWNRQRIVTLLSQIPGLNLQPQYSQGVYKISYFYDQRLAPQVEKIKRLLLQNEQNVNLFVAFGQYLDIIPARASKGYALRWFAEQWDIPLTRIVSAGGSGADEDMMLGNTLSVVVANRHQEELSDLGQVEPIYFSEKQFSAGILDGLEYYDFFDLCNKAAADT
ncbi:MAG: HAD-IIB family hydrolase [Limnothrix sp. RL_2_0]|nr:HAD-IIB family hydrolase [Limnothrix sp. RL_2_0]